ncbi:hypothetical protein BGZ83_010760 [Gryganskiella cystojenkinii]|nr:hypothetical protein BGZ83_010760 [Gryganskiella cystojenkinii]
MDSRPKQSFSTVRVPSSASSNVLSKRSPFSPTAPDSLARPPKRIMQHPSSTTPKAPPNPEYFDFIRKNSGISLRDLDTVPESFTTTPLQSRAGKHSHSGNIVTVESSFMQEDSSGTQHRQHEQQQQQEQERQQYQDNIQDSNMDQDQDEDLAEIDRLPLNSNIMAFARKSIMQSATTQPRSIFSRLNEKKLQGVKPSSLASAQPPPREPKITSRTPTGPIPEKPKISSVTSVLSRPTHSSATSSPSNISVTSTKPTPSSTVVTPVATPTATTATPKPSIPLRGVLDFSGGSALPPRLEKPVSVRPSTPTVLTPPTNMVSRDAPSAPKRSPAAPLESTMEGAPHQDAAPKKPAVEAGKETSSGFDLRALLRQDSARMQYQLPNLTASLSPPTSPKRPSPYAVPSLKEREALRARRMPRFKARPLNPKMFTGAGDTGVPKIAKQPLTVPVSPVFSRTRPRRDMISNIAGQDKGKSQTTSRTTTASRLKEVLKMGVKTVERNNTTATNATASALPSSLASVQGGTRPGFEHISRLPERSRTTALTADLSSRTAIHTGTAATPIVSAMKNNTSFARQGIQVGGGAGGLPLRSQSNLRRPAGQPKPTLTKPTPFKFATTELQQKRVNAANSNTLTLDDLA